jgi:hypothetical protein
MDSCCFVLKLVGVCRASENGEEQCSNKVGRSYSWRGYYLQVCAACPTPRLIPKGSNPIHPAYNIHDMFPSRTWPATTPQLLLHPLFPCIMQPIIPSTQSSSVTRRWWQHTPSYTMGTGYFPGVKRPGYDIDHPSPPSVKVKERVELYLYSPFGPLWPVLGWTLPFNFYFYTPWHISNRVLINMVSQPKGCNPHQQWCQILKSHMVQCA